MQVLAHIESIRLIKVNVNNDNNYNSKLDQIHKQIEI